MAIMVASSRTRGKVRRKSSIGAMTLDKGSPRTMVRDGVAYSRPRLMSPVAVSGGPAVVSGGPVVVSGGHSSNTQGGNIGEESQKE